MTNILIGFSASTSIVNSLFPEHKNSSSEDFLEILQEIFSCQIVQVEQDYFFHFTLNLTINSESFSFPFAQIATLQPILVKLDQHLKLLKIDPSEQKLLILSSRLRSHEKD